MNLDVRAIRWLGVALAVLAVWPMARALDALTARDYLGGILLLALTYVPARTGVELASLGTPHGTGDREP